MKADRNIKIDGVWYRPGDELPEQKVSEPVKAAEPEPVAKPEPENEPVQETIAEPEPTPEEEKPKTVRTSANRRKTAAK